jgi:hypothetical protein
VCQQQYSLLQLTHVSGLGTATGISQMPLFDSCTACTNLQVVHS